MPELIEVEQYRRALDPLVGSLVTALDLRHPEFIRPAGTPGRTLDVVQGGRLIATRRHGKLLLLDIAGERFTGLRTLGIRFGMTGMLFVDGIGPIDRLEYASARQNPAWDRLVLVVADSSVTIRDQRRLGSVELDPDTTALGPDATDLEAKVLLNLCAGRRRPIKSLLLDQSSVAGLGNLLTDEVLWRAGIAPRRPAESLSAVVVADLATTIRSTIEELSARGGSHRGDSFAHRIVGALCPKGDGVMESVRIGGRTTWWCPGHQT